MTAVDPNSFQLYVDYPLPEWSAKPTQKYYLEVIKSGIILEEKGIDEKEFYLLGKLPDLSDIPLEHPSISRKHAVIQHKNNGEVYIYDLNSSHGTFVNNKKIEPRTFFRLSPNDLLRFGFSTRFYVLRCPDLELVQKEEKVLTDMGLIRKNMEHSNENEKKAVKKNLKEMYLDLLRKEDKNNFFAKKKKQNKETENFEGISWGISDEGQVYDYEDENNLKMDPAVLKALPGLSEKQMEKIEAFEVKLNKYESLNQEVEGLWQKERREFGLDEGSRARKENAERKLQETASQLEGLESAVKLILFDEQTIKRKFEKAVEEDSFMDDDYFDRTRKIIKTEGNNEKISAPAENFQTLKEKLTKLLTERDELNMRFLNFSEETKEKEDELDELDKYMLENTKKIANEGKQAIFQQLEKVNKEIEETQKLLRIVKPEKEINEKIDIKPFSKKLEKEKKPKEPIFSKPLDRLSQTLQNLRKIAEKKKQEAEDPDQIKPESSDSEKEEEKELNENQMEIEKPAKKKIYSVPPKPPSRNLKEKDFEKKGLENLEWMPPDAQSGDGMTKLNKKLGY